jgi:hypothetical protein
MHGRLRPAPATGIVPVRRADLQQAMRGKQSALTVRTLRQSSNVCLRIGAAHESCGKMTRMVMTAGAARKLSARAKEVRICGDGQPVLFRNQTPPGAT